MKASIVDRIQGALRQEDLDGWLFYSFRGSDPIAENILQLGNARLATRRLRRPGRRYLMRTLPVRAWTVRLLTTS